MKNIESRVTDLEIQISHQIRMLDELNSVIILQQKQIDKMNKVNSFLLQNFKNSSANDNQIASDDITRTPPHY